MAPMAFLSASEAALVGSMGITTRPAIENFRAVAICNISCRRDRGLAGLGLLLPRYGPRRAAASRRRAEETHPSLAWQLQKNNGWKGRERETFYCEVDDGVNSKGGAPLLW